ETELEKKLQSIISQELESDTAQEAQKKGLPFSNLQGMPVDAEALSLLDEATARDTDAAVVYKNGTALIVAVLDPEKASTKAALQTLQQKGYTLKVIITTKEALESTWKRYQTIKTTELFEVGAIEINEAEFDRLYSQVQTIAGSNYW
ncbi:MAG: hypothetical protein KW806_02830, partial [Candidatus Yanofskybacteria bacterium]|nr:hypothetical protein [Candidatus Yanofskybacteria bacterium]